MAKNTDLSNAKNAKKDEFYTQLEDIKAEMVHYENQFKGKIILMNCDDPTWSNFWRYFHIEFERLGLKKIIATHYEYGEVASYKMEYTGGNDADTEDGIRTNLTSNGDFRSPECIELLKEADIVVTNPPFSLFREYIALLMKYDKKFIIWSNNNAISYKEVFSLLKDNRIWLGYICNQTCVFRVPNDYKYDEKITKQKDDGYKYGKVPAISTFTNLDIKKRHTPFETSYYYSKKDSLYPELYPKFDNYDAICVDKVNEIPMDYDGIMGVPITFLSVFNPDEYEIVGRTENLDMYGLKTKIYTSEECRNRYFELFGKKGTYDMNARGVVNGIKKYERIFIKRKDGK